MGLLEKRRFKNFVVWANAYDETRPSTQKGLLFCVNNFSVYCMYVSLGSAHSSRCVVNGSNAMAAFLLYVSLKVVL